MFTPKRIGGFAWRLLLFYLLLAVAPRSGLREVYASAFRAGAGALFGTFGPHGLVRFELPDQASREQDTKVTFKNRRTGMIHSIGCSAWLMGYLPLAAFLAPMLATPIPWTRRWKALLWGVFWVHVFVVLRIFLQVLYGFCIHPPPTGLFLPGPFWMKVIGVSTDVISVSPVTTFVVPIFIWILVSFRREDWAKILETAPVTQNPTSG